MPKHLWGHAVAAFALCLALSAPALAGGNGTALKVSAAIDDTLPLSCAGNCTATITVSATTTGSASAATALLVSVDGGVTFSNIANVAPADWVGNGRFKTSPEQSITVSGLLGNGASTVVTVCFMQPGANGNPLKKDCADLTITTQPGDTGPPAPQ